MSAVDAAREEVLPLCREAIRYCSRSIRAVHRQEFDQAKGLLQSAQYLVSNARQIIDTCKELDTTGFFRDAQKELAEGHITLAVVIGEHPPSAEDLEVNAAAYLNGMGEAVGEIRRYLLDSMRQGDLSRGGELLSAMDDIYNILVTMDFPDAITGGSRHTTDMVRGVLERTRSDLTLAIRQKELEDRIRDFQEGT